VAREVRNPLRVLSKLEGGQLDRRRWLERRADASRTVGRERLFYGGAEHRFALRSDRGFTPAPPSPAPSGVAASIARARTGLAVPARTFAGSSFLAKPRIIPTLAFILTFKAGDALLFVGDDFRKTDIRPA